MELTLNEAINTGIKFHQAGDLVMAENIYNEILTFVPEHIDILHLKGVLANQRGDFKGAIALIQKAISLIPQENISNPAFSSYHQNLANAFFQDGDNVKAKEAYMRAIDINSTNVDARYNLSRLLVNEKLYNEALCELETVIKLVPTYINALLAKAEILLELGKFAEAKPFFEKKLEIDSFDYDANMGLAKCLFNLEQFQSAKELFEKCTKLGTNKSEPFKWLEKIN